MGFEILAIASLAMKTLGTIQQNKAAGEATRLANEQANAQADAEIAEFDRQREETNRIAAEDKSERVIEADKQFASMIVSMAPLMRAASLARSGDTKASTSRRSRVTAEATLRRYALDRAGLTHAAVTQSRNVMPSSKLVTQAAQST
jgi:hypothetical protein